MCYFIYKDFFFFFFSKKNNSIAIYKIDEQGFIYGIGNYIQ